LAASSTLCVRRRHDERVPSLLSSLRQWNQTDGAQSENLKTGPTMDLFVLVGKPVVPTKPVTAEPFHYFVFF
jgi:hypothetical protein